MTYQFALPELSDLPRLSAREMSQDPVEARATTSARLFDRWRDTLSMATILLLCTVLFRLPDLGNPTYHVDEAFYLLFGEKLNEGVVPYREIWDRKPFGLFLMYAAFARAGSFIFYQVAAMVFVWATSLVIAATAMRFAGRMAATASGILYIAMLGALAGGGGQSPVFYNLMIAVAAFLAAGRLLGAREPTNARSDVAAMLLCGVALTIKPTVLPEGIFLGLVLLTARWRATRDPTAVLLYALKLTCIAVLPTVLILAYFWANGGFDEYVFATVRSIFLTEHHASTKIFWQSVYLAKRLHLVVLVAFLGLGLLIARPLERNVEKSPLIFFIAGWLIASAAGFLMVPNFYDHYALPLAVPLALTCAAVFDRRPLGRAAAIATVGQMLLISGYPSIQIMRADASRDGYENASRLIANHAGTGCVFLYDVTAALYRGTRMCPANKYPFVEHLSNQREVRAIGVDPRIALQDVLAQRPSVIAISARPSTYTPNKATRAMVERYLASNYSKVGKVDLFDVDGHQAITVWQRRPDLGVLPAFPPAQP